MHRLQSAGLRRLLSALLLAAVASPSAQGALTAFEQVQPAVTCDGITRAPSRPRQHYVTAPVSSADRKPTLVVLLGGSRSEPASYRKFANYAASLGYGVINLAYENRRLIANACLNNDYCYEQFRGEVAFGEETPYDARSGTYNSGVIRVSGQDSIINRLTCALDHLANEQLGADDPLPDRSYWSKFLVADPASPYVTRKAGRAYPAWNRIILVGHSQGGGNAAFLGARLPVTSVPMRVVLFSAPQDNTNGDGSSQSASWILKPSATPLDRYFGLRSSSEGAYGNFVVDNWSVFGGTSSGGMGLEGSSAGVSIGPGNLLPATVRHRLVVQADRDRTFYRNHNATIVDTYVDQAMMQGAWRYLLQGGP